MSEFERGPHGEPTEDGADDQVIGAAFRWSLIVGLSLLSLVAAVLLVMHLNQGGAGAQVEEAGVDLRLSQPAVLPQPPAARFVDVTSEAGIDFVHDSGARGDRLLPETMGGGVAFLDHDGDGDQDLLFVDSGPWPDAGEAAGSALRLYANDGRGSFDEITATAGLDDVRGYGMGAAVGDYDGDGRIDIYLTAVGENRLLRNTAAGFIAVDAGVAGDAQAWSTAAAFVDYDADGWLDLFVVNYVRWSREIDFAVDYRLTGIGRAYGPPSNFEGAHPVLYRNLGDGRFEDVSAEAGVQIVHPSTGRAEGKGLAIAVHDFDRDGHLDLFVANDTVRNFVFRNLGNGRFEEVGTLWGMALDRGGHATGAMGVDSAHYRNDALLAVAVGNFANEMTSFYVDAGRGGEDVLFADEAIVEGIGPATRLALSFGLFFFDYDLDGRLDLLQANGHVENEIHRVQSSQTYGQPGQLFWNCGDACPGAFLQVPADQLGDLSRPIVGRGAAYADIDADGDLDVVLTQIDGAPMLLRNDTPTGAHWLRVQLAGRAPNTAAIGAVLVLEADGDNQYRTVVPTRSYLSQVELPVTFGLGAATQAERLRIRWPDGSEQIVEGLAVDRLHRIEQP